MAEQLLRAGGHNEQADELVASQGRVREALLEKEELRQREIRVMVAQQQQDSLTALLTEEQRERLGQ